MQVVMVFAAVIAFTVLAVAFSLWRRRHRSRQMARAAARSGAGYQADGVALLREGLSVIPLLAPAAYGQGRVSNVIATTALGLPVHVCDFAYWNGSVNSTRFDYRQTLACFPVRNHLTAFTLHPRGGPLHGGAGKLNRVAVEALAGVAAPMMGAAQGRALQGLLREESDLGMDVAGCPEFAAVYRLLGSDRASLQRLFSPAVARQLLALAKPVCLECAGNWLVLYRKNAMVDPDRLPDFLHEAATLVQPLLPS